MPAQSIAGSLGKKNGDLVQLPRFADTFVARCAYRIRRGMPEKDRTTGAVPAKLASSAESTAASLHRLGCLPNTDQPCCMRRRRLSRVNVVTHYLSTTTHLQSALKSAPLVYFKVQHIYHDR